MAELVLRCVRTIETTTQNQPYEIIVIDNASGGDDIAKLSARNTIKLVYNAQNVGFGTANNQGARMAQGKYLFFLNPDAYLLNDAVSIWVDFMEKPENHSVACCGADLVDEQGNKQMAYGNFPSLAGIVSELGFYRFYRKYFEQNLSISLRNYGEGLKYVDYLLGAAMFVRTDIFKQVGGFDEDFFLYFEETELAYRFKKAGYRCVLIPQAKIMHSEGSFEKDCLPNYAKIKWFSESRQRYFKKTKGWPTAFAAKVLLATQALFRWVYHRNTHYVKVFRIIAES